MSILWLIDFLKYFSKKKVVTNSVETHFETTKEEEEEEEGEGVFFEAFKGLRGHSIGRQFKQEVAKICLIQLIGGVYYDDER